MVAYTHIYKSSSAIAERPNCRVGHIWRRKHLKSGRAELPFSPFPLFPSITSFSFPFFSPIPPLTYFSLPLLYFSTLRSRPLNATTVSKLPSEVWGEAPADKRFDAYLNQRSSSSFEFCGFCYDVTFCAKDNRDTIYAAIL